MANQMSRLSWQGKKEFYPLFNRVWEIDKKEKKKQLYTPGPGETLSNYEVHLKNRMHRYRVNERLGNIPPPVS